MKGVLPVRIKSRADWRKWLEKNHTLKQDIWIVIYKKHTGKDWLSLEEAVKEALCFGWIDSTLRSIDDESYMLRFSPRRPNSVWSKINRERAVCLIEERRMTQAGLAAIEIAKLNGQWDKAYSSKEKPELPDDLIQALQEDDLAWTNFCKLSNSNQLMYVNWVETAKRDVTRRRRIQQVVEQSARGERPG